MELTAFVSPFTPGPDRSPSAVLLAPGGSWVSDCIPWLLMNYIRLSLIIGSGSHVTCCLPIFFFWKDVHFMDHFEDSPWICKVVWEIWIISHLFFEISCFVVFFAVSHCRLFLKRFSLAISILLLLVWGEPRGKSLDPRDPNLLQRWRERELGGKYRCLNYRYFSKGQRERQETETQKCFLLTWAIMSFSWGWK